MDDGRAATGDRRPPAPTGNRQLGADDRLDARAFRGQVKPRRAVDAVAIEQRERRIPERRRALDERFGQRGAVEERKGGRGVEFDVHGRSIEDRLRGTSRSVMRSRNSRQSDPSLSADVPFVAIPALRPPRPTSAPDVRHGPRSASTSPAGMPRRSMATRTGRPRSTVTRTATGGRKRRRISDAVAGVPAAVRLRG